MKRSLLALIALALVFGSAAAAASTPAELSSIAATWTQSVSDAGARVLADMRFRYLGAAMMLTGTVILALQLGYSIYRDGLQHLPTNGWATVLRILLVTVLFWNYTDWTSALFDATRSLGGLYQEIALSHAGAGASVNGRDPWAPVYALFHAIARISVDTEGSILGGARTILNLLVAIVLQLLLMALVVLAALSSIWAFFGYSLAKLIGLLFVPTLLSEHFGKFFDAWFSVFAGFLLYDLVVRLVLVVAILGLSAVLPDSPGAHPVLIENAWSALGYLLFGCVGVYGLFRAASLAGALSGAGLSLSDPLGRVTSSVAAYIR